LFAAVLFDCDGVLVDSETLATRALHRSVQSLGMDYTEQQVGEIFTGHSFPDCIAMVEERLGKPIPDMDSLVEKNRQFSEQLMRTELATMPGIETVLKQMSLPFALVTNSRTFELELKLSVTGLDKYFPDRHRFDSEKLAVSKPDPAIYRRAAEALGFDIRQCLVLEDSVPGLTAATRAGATVWAYRPHASAQQLRDFGVERVLQNWSELQLP